MQFSTQTAYSKHFWLLTFFLPYRPRYNKITQQHLLLGFQLLTSHLSPLCSTGCRQTLNGYLLNHSKRPTAIKHPNGSKDMDHKPKIINISWGRMRR